MLWTSVSVLNSVGKARLLVGVSALVAVGSVSTAGAEVLISSGATTNISCVSTVCTPTRKGAILNVTQLENLLASGNVKITTAGSEASDIFVNAKVAWASGNNLTLDAYHSITITKAVSVNGTGGLTLTTNDGGTGGTLSFGAKGHISFLSTANSLTINSAAYALVADTTTLASDIASNPSRNYALASDYNATGNSSFVTTTFTGNFEGLGNSISHLKLVSTNNNLGLFAQLGSGGAIVNVRLTGVVISGGFQSVAALVGWNEGYLAGDSAAGKVLVSGESAGGLADINEGTIVNCSSSVDIGFANNGSPGQLTLGGLVGLNGLSPVSGTIENSYATGSIRIGRLKFRGSSPDADGGLAGLNSGIISNSYATGSIADQNETRGGGLVGQNAFGGGNVGTIVDSYSTGAVTGGSDSSVGGLIGFDSTSGGVTTSYWDTTTSGITNLSQGAGNVSNDPGITGLSNTQLQAGLPAGFSSTIWGQNSSINGGLPYLLALPPS